MGANGGSGPLPEEKYVQVPFILVKGLQNISLAANLKYVCLGGETGPVQIVSGIKRSPPFFT